MEITATGQLPLRGITITPDIIKNLLPMPDSGPRSVVDLIPKSDNDISNLLQAIFQTKQTLTFVFGGVGRSAEEVSDLNYSQYLQFPNSKISQLAKEIVSPGDSNDTKAFKIIKWVIENVAYKSDEANYRMGEFWAMPVLTNTKRSGDCEDGAFLIHSLLLNAGVPPDRIRTYGGLVVDYGTRVSGHGWTAYQREVDNQWIVLDWCYYPNEEPIADRMTMKEDQRYLDDYWYVTAFKTVETPYSNRVANPDAVAPRGIMVDVYA